jgi:site-specific DNA-methyltransferase (adenine-specific)
LLGWGAPLPILHPLVASRLAGCEGEVSEGTLEQVLAGTGRWCVQHSDSLLALRTLPDACVDMVVTDPPYSSGGQFRGDRARPTAEKHVSTDASHVPDFEGDARDQRSFELWTSLWCAEAWRCAKVGAVGVLFSDWRQLGATADAFQAGGWVFRGVAAWDKTESTRPRAGGLRAQCEYLVWGTRGPLTERDVYLNGCFRVPVGKDKLHQAVKPDALLADLVRLCPPGGVVLDPFNGSGSTGLAALRAGLRYVGIEIVDSWAELSRERLRAEMDTSTLAARASGQTAMFTNFAAGDPHQADPVGRP